MPLSLPACPLLSLSQILYGLGFSDEDLKATVPVIFSNVIASMQALLKACADFSLAVALPVRVQQC